MTERLGFDEAWFAEHHHSDYGLIASPNLVIASLAHRTKHLRLGNLVNVLPLYDPMRLAEECGMLDILTGGRLNVGLGRGVPRDDLKHGLDRDTAQARFEEGIEIMMRSWTEETFTYSGKAWNYVDIVCRPRPSATPPSTDLLRRHFAGKPCHGGAARLEPSAFAPTTRQLCQGDRILSG